MTSICLVYNCVFRVQHRVCLRDTQYLFVRGRKEGSKERKEGRETGKEGKKEGREGRRKEEGRKEG